ncbi:MAG: hypothetical protein J2P31_21625 [Blastocatellia bacterium]|nr:hypothetical protein [Blastocatellia bacterium]
MNYCEASPTLQVELKKVSGLAQSDGGLPYRQILERQLMMVQELLKKFPDDFHLLKLQFDYRRNSSDFDRDALLAEYRTRMNERKGDPASVYFYARLLVGHNTKEAIEQLNKLTQRSPGFPWSYLELAEIYYYPAFRDSTKMHENLKKWMTMCPSLMDVFSLLSRSNDLELMGEAAKSLRARLESSPAAEDPSDWEKLWTLEFNLKPVPEHPQVRRQIAEDLKRLRAAGLNTKEWLALLQVGYRMADDKEGRKWAENEVLRLFPKSSSARSVVSARWLEEHPSPKTGDPREKWQAYYQALLKSTYEDRKLWPNDWSFWWSRFNAVRNLENSTGNEWLKQTTEMIRKVQGVK